MISDIRRRNHKRLVMNRMDQMYIKNHVHNPYILNTPLKRLSGFTICIYPEEINNHLVLRKWYDDKEEWSPYLVITSFMSYPVNLVQLSGGKIDVFFEIPFGTNGYVTVDLINMSVGDISITT